MRRSLGTPNALDRALWLSRLSDLILDGIQVPSSSPLKLTEWRRALREGRCDISVRAYSHVFISGPSDSTDESENVLVAGIKNGFQEVFSRRDLRRIVVAYSENAKPNFHSKRNRWKPRMAIYPVPCAFAALCPTEFSLDAIRHFLGFGSNPDPSNRRHGNTSARHRSN